MIAAAGAMRLAGGQRSGWDTSVVSRWPLDTLGVPTPGVLAYAV
jgi:tRNA A37 threonylcarbamoyltransferase TsaD